MFRQTIRLSFTDRKMPAPGENPTLDAETRVPILIGVSVAFMILSVTVVLLRLFTRYAVVKALGSDDYTILIAVVSLRCPLRPVE